MQDKKIKIAIVTYNLDLGGLTRTTINLFNLLNEIEGIKVELLLLDYSENVDSSISHKIFNSKTDKTFIEKKISKYIRFKKYLKKSSFNFIIDQRYRLNGVAEIFITKYLYTKTKVIYTVHSSKLETYLPKPYWLSRFLYQKAFKIVCCSEGIKDLIEKQYKLTNTKRIYNFLPQNDFDEIITQPYDFKYIIAVGRFEPLKQFDRLIESYANSKLPQNNVKLVLVGEGSQLDYCKRFVKRLNVVDKIIFTGYVKNPKALIANAEFLVLCSEYEGFGMVLLESLICSTPVISFDLKVGPNEIINHNINGVLIEDQNFEELTNAMDELTSNRELLNKLKAKAKQSVDKFLSRNIIKDWLELLSID